MKILFKYGLLLIFAFQGSCIEPFFPEIDDYEDLLVVEALISGEESSQVVQLSRSYAIDTSYTRVETGASVSINAGSGGVFQFNEASGGRYMPTAGSFDPIPGESYVLSIITSDGKSYQSEPVLMKITPPVENLYYERESVPSEKTGEIDDGYRIYVDTGTGRETPGYYKFDYEETWEVVPIYPSYYDYDPQRGGIIIRENNISDCWISSSSTNLNILSTENITTDIIKKHPIRFVPFREALLNVKYSILVRQYTLSEQGYYFWKNLEESNETTGSLYDKQPFQVIGNIRNVNNPAEPVLGYFDMATVSTKRIFIDKFELPEGVKVPSLYTNCKNGADTIVSEIDVPVFLERGYLISYFIFMQGYVMAYKNCVDCRLKGSNVKPEFWE